MSLFEEFTAYHKLSYKQKKAKDYQWVEDNANQVDSFLTDTDKYHEFERITENYMLANANGQDLFDMKSRKDLGDSRNKYGSSKVKHFDILRRILTRMWGEQQKRRLQVVALDVSKYNQNLKKKKTLELYQDHITNAIINPLQEEVQQSIFQKHGIENPLDLKPEEQDQINSEIEQKLRFKTPADINKFMRKDYKSPSESQLQKLSDWLIKEYNLKFLFDECYKDLTIAGFNAVEIDIKNKRPWIKQVNPRDFSYYNPEETPFIEDGEWWMNERHIPYSKFINEYCDTEEDFKKFKKAIKEGFMGDSSAERRQIRGEIPHQLTRALANEAIVPAASIDPKTGAIDYSIPNINSEQGQSFYTQVMSLMGSDSKYSLNTIRVARIIFSSLAEIKYVERIDKKTGKLTGYFVGENYEENPDIDHKVTSTWHRELWEAHKAGYGGGVFMKKRRTPFQNRSLNDPFKIYSPFIGVEFSKLHNNSKRIAPIDLGKVYNYEYNTVKNEIERLEETNIGKVFAFPEKAIPDNYDVEDFIALMKTGKIAPINLDNIEFAQMAQNMFKSIDLSNEQDIMGRQQRLLNIERECQEAMSYSPSLMGEAPASMTATNNQQNIIQGSYAMEDLSSLQRKFEENTMNAFANLTRNALRDNEQLRTYLLDDLSIAELELSPEVLNLSDIAIKVTNDTQEVQDARALKNLLQPMVQNQMVGVSDVIKIQFTDSPADLINLAEDIEEKTQQRAEKEAQAQQKQYEEDLAFKKEQIAKQDRMDMLRLELDELSIRLEADKYRLSEDVDKNNIPDTVQKAVIDNESKEKINAEKIASDEKIEMAKIEQADREAKIKQQIEETKAKIMKLKKTV